MTDAHMRVIRTTTRVLPWWIPLLTGIVVIAAGVGLTLWPFIAAKWVLVIIVGSALIANGLALIVRSRPSAGSLIASVLLIVAGVAAIIFSEFTATALVTFVGGLLIAVGVFWLLFVAGFGANVGGIALVPAIVLILAGIVTFVWPEFALSLGAVICGFFTLVLGASLVWGAIRLRGAGPRAGGRDSDASHTTIIIE